MFCHSVLLTPHFTGWGQSLELCLGDRLQTDGDSCGIYPSSLQNKVLTFCISLMFGSILEFPFSGDRPLIISTAPTLLVSIVIEHLSVAYSAPLVLLDLAGNVTNP